MHNLNGQTRERELHVFWSKSCLQKKYWIKSAKTVCTSMSLGYKGFRQKVPNHIFDSEMAYNFNFEKKFSFQSLRRSNLKGARHQIQLKHPKPKCIWFSWISFSVRKWCFKNFRENLSTVGPCFFLDFTGCFWVKSQLFIQLLPLPFYGWGNEREKKLLFLITWEVCSHSG